MRLYIAEKPDLAKAIGAGIDGAFKQEDGYFIKSNNIITWGFGHLLEQYEPEDYDEKYKNWTIESLPIIIGGKFRYKPKNSSKKQLKIVCDLINDSRVTEIVNAGDADEEGQILIDEILEYSKTTKPTFRVLLQDLTPKGIKKSIDNIQPNSNFKGLSESGFARSQADWIVGMNLTRAYTIRARQLGYQEKAPFSLGRVQTPILALVVNRDKEHESHKSSYYYTIQGKFNTKDTFFLANLKLNGNEKITDEDLANQIKDNCTNQVGLITKAINENKKEYAPLPYNLLLLQADCSKKFGYKPDKTLEITQTLREKHKLITYNRSDCQYLPENMFGDSPEILQSVKATMGGDYDSYIDNANTTIKSLAFNDKNITAHYAIIPTNTRANKADLSKEELNVYELIAKRFIVQFYPPKEYIHTEIEVTIKDYIFLATQNKTTKAGYTEVFENLDISDKENDDSDEAINGSDLSDLANAQISEAICDNIKIDKKSTKPKPYYTTATLLKDLTSISKYVKDERIKQLLKDKDKDKKGENGGIGTPATRSEHIKKLFEREFIKEQGKNIISTKKGRDFISLAPEILTVPDMTALWFERQVEIENGELNKNAFLAEIFKVVNAEIDNVKNSDKLKILANIDKTYPCKCGKGYLVRKKSVNKNTYWWGCSAYPNCTQTYFDNKGKPSDEYFGKKPEQKTKQETSDITCPKCNKGKLIRRKNQKGNYWWGCSAYPNCKAMFYDNNGQPNLKG